jgi:hypothetical protein
MILSFTLVSIALAVLLLLLFLEGGHNDSIQRLEDLAGRTRPVDLEAFRNLMDPKEDDFLRSNLLPHEFRAVQRERALSAIDYILNTMHNAAVLLRLGEAATRSSNQSVALAGRQLAENAVRLRAYALLSVAKLGLRMVLPGARWSNGRLADTYQDLSGLAGQLALIQYPTQAARLSTLL